MEVHLECEKHAVMLGCLLCKAIIGEEGATHLQNG